MDPLVNRIDPVSRRLYFIRRPEREVQHRPHCPPGPAEIGQRSAPVITVVSHRRRDQWMSELQQNGSSPSKQHDSFLIDPTDHLTGHDHPHVQFDMPEYMAGAPSSRHY